MMDTYKIISKVMLVRVVPPPHKAVLYIYKDKVMDILTVNSDLCINHLKNKISYRRKCQKTRI